MKGKNDFELKINELNIIRKRVFVCATAMWVWSEGQPAMELSAWVRPAVQRPKLCHSHRSLFSYYYLDHCWALDLC